MIKNYLKSFHVLTDGDIESFIRFSTRRSLNKSVYFIRETENCQEAAQKKK